MLLSVRSSSNSSSSSTSSSSSSDSDSAFNSDSRFSSLQLYAALLPASRSTVADSSLLEKYSLNQSYCQSRTYSHTVKIFIQGNLKFCLLLNTLHCVIVYQKEKLFCLLNETNQSRSERFDVLLQNLEQYKQYRSGSMKNNYINLSGIDIQKSPAL